MPVRRVCIAGSGFMGHGIGQEYALAGYQTTLYDVDGTKLAWAVRSIERNLRELAGWGIIEAGQVQPTMNRLRTSTDLGEAAGDADLVIEAVFEDLEVKREVFRQLDAVCPAGAILASNSSTLMPSLLAQATARPERVLGIHYFYPVSLIPLVEVVCGKKTDPGIVETVRDLLLAMGKSPVIVRREAPGFISNRLQFALQREALYIVEQGIATAQDVDKAVRDGFGRRLALAGPFEIAEPIGWDLELRIQEYLFPHLDDSAEPSRLVVEKVDRGELGVKTGKGFYDWTAESADAWRKAMAAALAARMRADRPSAEAS
jgi:3-hydroxybutyryl-CoA dehydrogenase